MKKLIFFSFFLIISVVFYYYSRYSSYSVTSACIEITNFGKGDVELIPAEENSNCLKILTGSKGEKKNISETISGIRYGLINVVPEKKNDDHLGRSDETPYEEPEKNNETVIRKEAEKESPDILIAIINGNESEGFTKEELFESVISIQNLNPDIDLIVTDRFEIPSEKIVLKNAEALDVNGISSVITVRYKVVLDENGTPFSIMKKSLDRRYPDTGKIQKKM